MRETYRIARDNLKGTLRTRKREYDVKLKTETCQVGDFVYKTNSSIKKGLSTKLLPIYDGPFIVTRVLSPILIEIENCKRQKVVYHDELKHCNDRCIPLWIRHRRQELLSLDDTLPYDEENTRFWVILVLISYMMMVMLSLTIIQIHHRMMLPMKLMILALLVLMCYRRQHINLLRLPGEVDSVNEVNG